MTHTPSAPTTVVSQDIWFAGTLMRVLADHASTNGQFALLEQRAPQGFSPPTHVHQLEDQLLYVLDGKLAVRVGDDHQTLRAGDTVWLPRGVPHTFCVESVEARLLEITTPAGFEQFHLELGEPAWEPRIPDFTPVDPAAIAATSARYGCEIVGGPMERM